MSLGHISFNYVYIKLRKATIFKVNFLINMRECTRSFQGNYRAVHMADVNMTL
jgi:hypothetical protein